MSQHPQHPLLAVIDGDGMSADDAAWAMIADTAEAALTLPGLSPPCAVRLGQMSQACRSLAGLPARARLPSGAGT